MADQLEYSGPPHQSLREICGEELLWAEFKPGKGKSILAHVLTLTPFSEEFEAKCKTADGTLFSAFGRAFHSANATTYRLDFK